MKHRSFLLLLSIAIFTPQIASANLSGNFGQPIEAYQSGTRTETYYDSDASQFRDAQSQSIGPDKFRP